jgi:hypothetical protein
MGWWESMCKSEANGSGSERQIDGEGLEIAHNGVRGDDVVEVREARRGSNRITNRTRRTV